MELINVTIYEPDKSLFKGSGNDKAASTYWYCSKVSECDYLKDGGCLNVGALGKPCPYGSKSTKTGFTKRARKYREFILQERLKNEHLLWKIKAAPKRIGKIGDQWFLPYSFIALNESVGFKAKAGFMTDGQPLLDDLTPKIVDQLCRYRPQALFGGEIKDYQEKVVPKFVKDLQDFYPTLYRECVAEYPYIAERIEQYSYVGRRALVSTLRKGCVIDGSRGAKWTWDGEHLVSTNLDILFPVVKYTESYVKLKPKDGESIKITSNYQVSPETIFAD